MELYLYSSIFRKLLVLMHRNGFLPLPLFVSFCLFSAKILWGSLHSIYTLHFVLIMPERPRPSGNAFTFEMQALAVIILHFGLSVFHLSLSPSTGNCHNSLVMETASLPNVVPQQSVTMITRKEFYHFLSPRGIPFSPTLSTVAVTTFPHCSTRTC